MGKGHRRLVHHGRQQTDTDHPVAFIAVLRATTLFTQPEPQSVADAGVPRLLALDGLRGIAVTVVFFFHFTQIPLGGYLGVDLFFVLSGYLITNVILKSSEELPALDAWKLFYYGRVLRIFPALFEMLGLYGIMKLMYPAQITLFTENVVSSLFMYSNWTRAFHYPYPDYLGHTWSLAIEEQFYLLWPILLLVLLKCRLRNAALVWFTGGLVLTLWLVRFAMVAHNPDPDRLYNGTDTRIDAILIGCLAAFIARTRTFRAHVTRKSALSGVFFTLAVAIGLWMVARINWPDLWLYRYGLCLFTLSSTVIVLYLSTFSDGLASRCFSWKPLVYVGKRSYAVYLFHLPIFMFLIGIYKLPIGWKVAAIGGPATLLLAALSWRFVEQPALRLKSRKYERVLKAYRASAAS
jgi:peptidoglycan/LPS O-acetylase OafA/YrhL